VQWQLWVSHLSWSFHSSGLVCYQRRNELQRNTRKSRNKLIQEQVRRVVFQIWHSPVTTRRKKGKTISSLFINADIIFNRHKTYYFPWWPAIHIIWDHREVGVSRWRAYSRIRRVWYCLPNGDEWLWYICC